MERGSQAKIILISCECYKCYCLFTSYSSSDIGSNLLF
uniref:Uncharacterized protein n=1 Tax=Rhizophora mucronata TaxID=61149 RepID=A0A2P2QED4_RHIMU